jgi:hypothetical protein
VSHCPEGWADTDYRTDIILGENGEDKREEVPVPSAKVGKDKNRGNTRELKEKKFRYL